MPEERRGDGIGSTDAPADSAPALGSPVSDAPASDARDKTQALRHSVLVTGLSGLGNVTAPVADMVIAARYGLGSKTDALFVALTVPQLVASLLLVSFNVTLVPIFSAVNIEEGAESLWRFASNLLNICLVTLSLLAALGAFSSHLIVSLVAPGLDPETRRLGQTLSVLLFLMLVPLGAVEVTKALLNVLHTFGPPASTNFLRNSAVILVTLLLGRQWDINAVAIGYVIGAWLQFVVLGIALLSKGFRYTPRWSLREVRDRAVWQSLRLPLLGGALNLSNTLIERFLVSFLPTGTISALGYARRILWAADSVFLGSIATVLLPRLSDQSARRNEGTFRRYLNLGLKLSLFIALPIMAGTMVLGVPVVRLIFQRGAFDQFATRATATYLVLYMLSLPASALIQMLLAGFYARHNTVTPFYILVSLLALTFVFDVGLFFVLQARGLALGLSLAKLLGAALGFYLLNRSVGSFSHGLGRFVAKALGASLAMAAAAAAAAFLVQRMAGPLSLGSQGSTVLQLLIGGLTGVAVYALGAFVLRIPEVMETFHLVKDRLSQGKLAAKPLG